MQRNFITPKEAKELAIEANPIAQEIRAIKLSLEPNNSVNLLLMPSLVMFSLLCNHIIVSLLNR